jgi:hypothetical protein
LARATGPTAALSDAQAAVSKPAESKAIMEKVFMFATPVVSVVGQRPPRP